jgi:predicted aldo/keto reductase-like oxidoreductase
MSGDERVLSFDWEDTMDMRMLGQNLEVSALGLGCMCMTSSVPPFPEKREMVALIRTAVDRGYSEAYQQMIDR